MHAEAYWTFDPGWPFNDRAYPGQSFADGAHVYTFARPHNVRISPNDYYDRSSSTRRKNEEGNWGTLAIIQEQIRVCLT